LIAFVSINNVRKQNVYEKSPSLLYDEIIKQTKKTLPHYMIPKIVKQIQEFPQTANGKLDKLKLATLIETNTIDNNNDDDNKLKNNNNNDEDVDILLQSNGISMATFLIKSVKKINNQNSNLNSTFAAVGIDSLAAILFKNYLSQSLGEL